MITAIASLYALASSGLIANQTRLDVVADNIANSSTTGFKSYRALAGEALAPASEVANGEDVAPYEGVRVLDISPDLSQGMITPSESAWHLAIDGPGFFQIRLPDGTLAYTRDGQFQVDGNGQLVTATGYALDPTITVPAQATAFVVNADGVVLGMFEAADETPGQIMREMREVGRVSLVGFVNPDGLHRTGHNLLLATPASGEALAQRPNGERWADLIGGATESSNTSLVEAMTDLVAAQRAYALCVRVLQTIDESAQFANELVS
ncbi:MAG TPA: flagellar hook-basal body complex protein [Anaerolineae bacterium]|nr:flagellar hook-basal body complex protein [Anaerolineae bacterium]